MPLGLRSLVGSRGRPPALERLLLAVVRPERGASAGLPERLQLHSTRCMLEGSRAALMAWSARQGRHGSTHMSLSVCRGSVAAAVTGWQEEQAELQRGVTPLAASPTHSDRMQDSCAAVPPVAPSSSCFTLCCSAVDVAATAAAAARMLLTLQPLPRDVGV